MKSIVLALWLMFGLIIVEKICCWVVYFKNIKLEKELELIKIKIKESKK